MTSPDPVLCSSYFFLCFLMAGTLQTVWMKSDYAKHFAVAIDHGHTVRNRRIFGDNKTWRGFVVMVPVSGLAFVATRFLMQTIEERDVFLWPLSNAEFFLLGSWTGLGFMLGELPNSFLKRQFDIDPGAPAQHPFGRRLCFLVDQTDCVVGGLIFVSVFVPVPLESWIFIVVTGGLAHLGFNYVLLRMGLRERAA